MFLVLTLGVYAVGLVLTAVGSRLAGRCATWCCALCGFPMWVVSGTVAALSVALPQLVLAFLASGLSITSMAVGVALAGAVTDLGLVLALCLLRRSVTVDRGEFCRKCIILLAACLVLVFFAGDGVLTHTGAGLLMGLFVLFVLESILYQYRLAYDEDLQPIGVGPHRLPRYAAVPAVQTMAYGDPMNYELGLFGDYTVRVDESVKAVERMLTVLGDAMVGGNLIVDKGFVVATVPKTPAA